MKKLLMYVVMPGLLTGWIPMSWADVIPLGSPAASAVVSTISCPPCAISAPAPTWVYIMVFVLVVAFLLISLLSVKGSLKDGGWSLAHALSEEMDGSAVPNPAVEPAAAGTVMVGSASRLIAFIGMLVILAFFIGIGLWMLWKLLSTGCVPSDLDKLTSYFYGGAMLFAPYMANQFKAALSAISK